VGGWRIYEELEKKAKMETPIRGHGDGLVKISYSTTKDLVGERRRDSRYCSKEGG